MCTTSGDFHVQGPGWSLRSPWPLYLAWAALSLQVVQGEENRQLWCEQTYIGDPLTFTCARTDGTVPFRVSFDQVTLNWTKQGHPDPIRNDEFHRLRPKDGVENMMLTFLGVREESEGIYICHVISQEGQVTATVVKGLNLGGPKYEDLSSKYRSNIIIGFFSALSFCLVASGTCYVLNHKICNSEERDRRRLLHAEREDQQRRVVPEVRRKFQPPEVRAVQQRRVPEGGGHGRNAHPDGGFVNLAMTASSGSLGREEDDSSFLREVMI